MLYHTKYWSYPKECARHYNWFPLFTYLSWDLPAWSGVIKFIHFKIVSNSWTDLTETLFFSWSILWHTDWSPQKRFDFIPVKECAGCPNKMLTSLTGNSYICSKLEANDIHWSSRAGSSFKMDFIWLKSGTPIKSYDG